MSKASPNTSGQPRPEHGTLRSYVIGFVLSLVFTLIPYYLIIQKTLTGNFLLAAILGFAVLQLIIQVVFFLHLGREPRPRWNLLFLLSTISIILVVVVGSIWIMNHLHYNMMSTDTTNKISEGEAVYQIGGVQTGTCPGGTGASHKVVLKNNTANPTHVDARLCDTLTIANEGDSKFEIVFGTRDAREMYAGETGEGVYPGRSVVITLTEPGTHRFHDQTFGISGDFTVTP